MITYGQLFNLNDVFYAMYGYIRLGVANINILEDVARPWTGVF
jgi:hypothetical protein